MSGLLQPNSMTSALVRSQPAEPPDLTNQYNTQLTPEEEAAYQAWGQQQAAHRPDGRNPATDTFDYDMRGFWKSGGGFAANGHAGDRFKKPNHPTFSTYSQYNGVDGYQGGQWSGGNGQPWQFTPSPTNLKMNDQGDLQRYFQEQEKGNSLILPTPTPAPASPPVQRLPPTSAVSPAPSPMRSTLT